MKDRIMSDVIKMAKERVLEFKSINSLLNFNNLVDETLNGKHSNVSKDLADKILAVYNKIDTKLATQNIENKSFKLEHIAKSELTEFNKEIEAGNVDPEVVDWFKNSAHKTAHAWIEDIHDLKTIVSSLDVYGDYLKDLPLKSDVDKNRADNRFFLALYDQVDKIISLKHAVVSTNKLTPEELYVKKYNELVKLIDGLSLEPTERNLKAIEMIKSLPDANQSPRSFKMAIEHIKNHKTNHINIKNIGMTKDEFVAIKNIAKTHKIPLTNERLLDSIFKQQFHGLLRELKIGLFMARTDGVSCAKVINNIMNKCPKVDKDKLIKGIIAKCEKISSNFLNNMDLNNKIMFLENIKSHQLKYDLIIPMIKTPNPEFKNYSLKSLPFNSSVTNIVSNDRKVSDLLKVNIINGLVDEKKINVNDLTFNEESYSDYVESFKGNARVRNEVTEHIVNNTVIDLITGNYPIPYYDGATANELSKNSVDTNKITEMVLNDSINNLTRIDPSTKEYFSNVLQIANGDFEYISKNKIEGILNELSSNNHFEKQPQVVKNNVHPDFN